MKISQHNKLVLKIEDFQTLQIKGKVHEPGKSWITNIPEMKAKKALNNLNIMV